MRIIDWSSDVCSSDLHAGSGIGDVMSLSKLPSIQPKRFDREELGAVAIALTNSAVKGPTYLRVDGKKIGRESCRERVGQYVSIPVVAVSIRIKKKVITTVNK